MANNESNQAINIVMLEIRANFHGFTAWNTKVGLLTIEHPFAPPSVRTRTYKLNGKEASRLDCALALAT